MPKGPFMRGKRAAVMTEYAIQTADASEYEKNLGMAPIKRMHAECRTNHAKLIIVDIPQIAPPDPRDDKPSAAKPVAALLKKESDAFIGCHDVLGEYRGVTTFHVPHGSQHISSFTHLMYGTKIAQDYDSPCSRAGQGTGPE